MVLKALIWRGFSYEREEKVKWAKEDFEMILKYTPHDLEAKKALWRVNEAIKHNELEEKSWLMMSPTLLLQKLTDFKEKGNVHFKSSNYTLAVKEFDLGIELFKENHEVYHLNKSMFKEIITAIYTNKCLANSKLQNTDDTIIEDSNYVLYHLDNNNLKALFRWAVCYKNKAMYKESLKDLEFVIKLDPNNKNAKDEQKIVKGLFDQMLQKQFKQMQDDKSSST